MKKDLIVTQKLKDVCAKKGIQFVFLHTVCHVSQLETIATLPANATRLTMQPASFLVKSTTTNASRAVTM